MRDMLAFLREQQRILRGGLLDMYVLAKVTRATLENQRRFKQEWEWVTLTVENEFGLLIHKEDRAWDTLLHSPLKNEGRMMQAMARLGGRSKNKNKHESNTYVSWFRSTKIALCNIFFFSFLSKKKRNSSVNNRILSQLRTPQAWKRVDLFKVWMCSAFAEFW